MYAPWQSCEICSDIPDFFQVYYHDDNQFPPATKKLIDIGGSRGFGAQYFQKCPLCQTFYYRHTDEVPYGSDTNDNISLTRFNQTDRELLQPLLETENYYDPLLARLLSKGLSADDEAIRDKTKLIFEYIIDKSMHRRNIMSLLEGLALETEPTARLYAFERLNEKASGKTDISEALSTLRAALNDEVYAAKRNSSEALAYHFVNQEKWPEIEELSCHHDIAVRNGLSWAVKNCINRYRYSDLGGDAKRGLATAKKIAAALLPAIRTLLSDKNGDVRSNAFGALEDAAHLVDISGVFDQAIGALADDNSEVKFHAAGAFKNAAMNKADISRAFPALIKLLSHESYSAQERAAEALGHAAHHGADIALAADALAYRITDDYQTFSGACALALREYAKLGRKQAALVLDRLRQPTIDKDLQTVVSLINGCKALKAPSEGSRIRPRGA